MLQAIRPLRSCVFPLLPPPPPAGFVPHSPQVQHPVFESHLLPRLLALLTGTDGEGQRLADSVEHNHLTRQQLNRPWGARGGEAVLLC